MYRDILNMPYPDSEIEKAFPDPVLRGAQFAPFAALTGHDEAISETARLTDGRILLSESRQEEINRTLCYLWEHPGEHLNISVTYFVPDEKKQGGAYVTKNGVLQKICATEQILLINKDTKILIPDILKIEITD